MSRLGTGLTRNDWLDEGQALLRDNGIDGVSIRTLTVALGVSKGSFYHHFQDLDDYLDALADYFSNEQMIAYFEQAQRQATDDPLTRMTELAKIVLKNDGRKLMVAMRAWAKSNRAAAVSVRKLDKASMEFLTDVFSDLGFAPKDARLRAYLFIAATVVDMDQRLIGLSGQEFQDRMIALTAHT